MKVVATTVCDSFFRRHRRDMVTKTQRAALFWLGCIPLRSLLTSYALQSPREQQRLLRLAAVLVGGRWVLGLHNNPTGFFQGNAWWADQRTAHGALWLGYAATGDGRFLAVDTAFGAGNWVYHNA